MFKILYKIKIMIKDFTKDMSEWAMVHKYSNSQWFLIIKRMIKIINKNLKDKLIHLEKTSQWLSRTFQTVLLRKKD